MMQPGETCWQKVPVYCCHRQPSCGVFFKHFFIIIIIIIKPRRIDNAYIVRAHNGVVVIMQVGRGQQKSVYISFWKKILGTNKQKKCIIINRRNIIINIIHKTNSTLINDFFFCSYIVLFFYSPIQLYIAYRRARCLSLTQQPPVAAANIIIIYNSRHFRRFGPRR